MANISILQGNSYPIQAILKPTQILPTSKVCVSENPSFLVGWQVTQKCNLEYIIKKMDFFFTTFLFSAQRLKKLMLY